MKKFTYLLFAGALSSMVLLNSCNKDEEENDDITVDECASATFPSTTGDATVKILNYTATSGAFTTIDANSGDVLSFAVEVTKGTKRPQDFRVYYSDCANLKGTEYGSEQDLRNTDDAQVKQFTFTVPSGYSTLYVNIEVDESGSTYTYKRIKLNISGSGIIDTWTADLGAQSNALPSRMSSGTGETYTACNAAANIDYIDITYAVSKEDGMSYLCSNPARFLTPVGLDVSTASCGEDGTLPTSGGNAAYFKAYSGSNSDFTNITDSQLSALTVGTSNAQYVEISALGTIYEFYSNGKKGLIKIVSGTLEDATGSVAVEVKVQR